MDRYKRQQASTSKFYIPPCDNSFVSKIMKEVQRIMIERDSVDICADGDNRVYSSEESSGSSNDSMESVIFVNDNIEEVHLSTFAMLANDYHQNVRLRRTMDMNWLRSAPDFYKRLMEHLFHTCNKIRKIRYRHEVRYLALDLLLRSLQKMYTWKKGDQMNEAMKKISFAMIYHCINISSKYIIRKRVFTMEDIVRKVKKCGFHTNPSNMKDMEIKIMNDLSYKIYRPNIHTYIVAMMPLTCLKNKLAPLRFMTYTALLMDFFYINAIDIFARFYFIVKSKNCERSSYSIDKHALLISAALIYATVMKFYKKESLLKLVPQMLASLSHLTGCDKIYIFLFAEIILTIIDFYNIKLIEI